MKQIALLLLAGMFISACATTPVPATATPISTLTLKPTRTLTPEPTLTITSTPAPSLPADFPKEFTAMIGDAKFETRPDDHIWVTAEDGQAQDWFQVESDGDGWRRSDTKLRDDAPKQQWWGIGETRGNNPQRYVYVVFPEPDKIIHSQLKAGNGTVYDIDGVEGLIPDNNNRNLLHKVLVPIKIWANGSLFLTMEGRCPGLDCEQGFKPNMQYEGYLKGILIELNMKFLIRCIKLMKPKGSMIG